MVWPGKGMGWKEFFRALGNEYKKDEVGNTAGSLTFFGILALFPFLLFLVSLASLFIDPNQANSLVQGLGKVAPGEVSGILGKQIQDLSQHRSAGLLTLGVIGALWAASGGVVALMQALNKAYDVEEGRPFWKVRLVAIGATLFAAAFSLVAVAVMLAIPVIANRLGGPLATAILLLRIPVAGLLMMFVWALLYYFLPDTEQKFSFITPGSVIGVIIWVVASWAFSFYVGHFGKYQATYGALGGIIVMLLWMWISSQVVLLGAEVNSILEHKSPEGKRRGAKSLADAGPSAASDEEEQRGTGRPVLRRRPEEEPRPPEGYH